MKRLYSIIGAVIITAVLYGQAPSGFKYQAVLRDASGNIRSNSNSSIDVVILQESAAGTQVFIENHFVTTNEFGLVNLEIGSKNPTGFSDIDWSAGPYFVKISVDNIEMGTSQLLSVPYALYAKMAENGFSGDYDDLNNKPEFTGWDDIESDDFSGSYGDLTNKPLLFDGSWNSLTGKPTFSIVATSGLFSDLLSKPTTLSGYGITDGMSTSHPANAITSTNISNWNTAFIWGNHSGLYRPISYVPAWSEVTGKPTTIVGFGITDAVITSGNQTIAGNKTFTGTISASNKNVINVADPVNTGDAVNKAYVDLLLARIEALEDFVGYPSFTDSRDGHQYKVVLIGNQIWMAENLKYLPSVVGPATAGSTPYFYVYGYNGTVVADAKATANYNTYGVLYNWHAAMNAAASSTAKPSGVQGVCPTGWHLPSDAEWTQLFDYLGETSVAGGKLKETGTSHWSYPNTGATNETGFTALPGGRRDIDGSFNYVGDYGVWWSATEESANGAWFWDMSYSNGSVFKDYLYKQLGFSIRCVRD
jgi:uncharacterized protein (TIGR02145 family)